MAVARVQDSGVGRQQSPIEFRENPVPVIPCKARNLLRSPLAPRFLALFSRKSRRSRESGNPSPSAPAMGPRFRGGGDLESVLTPYSYFVFSDRI